MYGVGSAAHGVCVQLMMAERLKHVVDNVYTDVVLTVVNTIGNTTRPDTKIQYLNFYVWQQHRIYIL
jgi:hypothetical protein